MATTRIKDITTAATTFSSDDFVAIDGATSGTRKMAKDDLITEVSSGVSGTYLEESNNLSDVDSLDTSKLNMEIPDVGSAGNQAPLNSMLSSMAYQDSAAISVGQAEIETLEVTDSVTDSLTIEDSTDPTLFLERAGIPNGFIKSVDANGTETSGIQLYSSEVRLRTGATQRVTIDSSGNLDVASGVTTLNNTGDNALRVESTNGNPATINVVGSAPNYLFDIRDDGTSKVRVDPSGNVTVNGGRLEAKPNSGTNTGSQGELRLYGHESNASRFAAIKCFNTGGTDQNALSFYTSSGGTETQRVRIDEVDGDVEVLTGSVIVGTAGEGIDLGATVLTEFEQGVFTASVAPAASGTLTIDTASDQLAYAIVGDIVTVHGQIALDGASSPVGNYVKINLPAAIALGTLAEDADYSAGSCVVTSAAGNLGDYSLLAVGGDSFVRIYKNTASTFGATAADFNGDESIYISITYRKA